MAECSKQWEKVNNHKVYLSLGTVPDLFLYFRFSTQSRELLRRKVRIKRDSQSSTQAALDQSGADTDTLSTSGLESLTFDTNPTREQDASGSESLVSLNHSIHHDNDSMSDINSNKSSKSEKQASNRGFKTF